MQRLLDTNDCRHLRSGSILYLREAIVWLGNMRISKMSIELDYKQVVDIIVDNSIFNILNPTIYI
jgi:hypothetical protein